MKSAFGFIIHRDTEFEIWDQKNSSEMQGFHEFGLSSGRQPIDYLPEPPRPGARGQAPRLGDISVPLS
eukprot:3042047-Pyramimonas_sp.AAC.1